MTDPECIATAADSQAVSHLYMSPGAERTVKQLHLFLNISIVSSNSN